MLNSRLLWKSLGLSLVEKTPPHCKCSKALKSNLIKTFNTENKYLYGGLLESQKQRRKKISKGLPTVLEKEDTVEPEHTLCQTQDVKKIKSSRNKQSEATEAAENTDTNKPKVSKSKKNVKSPLAKVLATVGKQAPSKQITNKSDKSTRLINTGESLDNHSEKTKDNLIKPASVTNEFSFQSLVLINEENYPLKNSDKLELSPNQQEQNVLSFGFSDSLVKDYLKYPSVSKIMEETMTSKSRFILSRWRQNMVKDLGEEGFSKHLAGLKTRGHEFHLAVRGTVLGEHVDGVGEVAQNALKSLDWLLRHISNPVAVESLTAHPALEYKGIPDCVAMFKDIPVLIDWKLSDKPKKNLKDTYEAPVQISAYIGALNHDPNYKWTVSHGLVAVAYASGDPCDVFLLAPKHCDIYWRHWLLRFDKFKARSHLHLDHNIDEKELELVNVRF